MTDEERIAELELRADAAELALGVTLRVIAEVHRPGLEAAEEVLLAWLGDQAEPQDPAGVRTLQVVMRAIERLGARDEAVEEQLPA
jgi:hypothetical protein